MISEKATPSLYPDIRLNWRLARYKIFHLIFLVDFWFLFMFFHNFRPNLILHLVRMAGRPPGTATRLSTASRRPSVGNSTVFAQPLQVSLVSSLFQILKCLLILSCISSIPHSGHHPNGFCKEASNLFEHKLFEMIVNKE